MNLLDQWEKRLEPYFLRPIQWIGEIPLSQRNVEEMADLIKDYLAQARRAHGSTHATDHLISNYPLSFIVFLCTFSAYNVNRDYWSSLANRLDVKRNFIENNYWRNKAYELLKHKGFRVLEREQDAIKYVNTLRLNGGIPRYSLVDFFSRIVLPSLQISSLSTLPAGQVIPIILKKTYHIDHPVHNFLAYSGEIGACFLEECRTIAKKFLVEHSLSDNISTFLPSHIRDELNRFLLQHENTTGNQFAAPRLTFNPYTEPYLGLHLPEQSISIQALNQEFSWQISYPGLAHPLEISTRIHKGYRSLVLREQQVSLSCGPVEVTVSLWQRSEIHEQLLRRWNLFSPGRMHMPILPFRHSVKGWALLSSASELPASQLLIVIPEDIELQSQSTLCENANPHLCGAWTNWKAQVWNLQDAISVRLLRNGQEICPPLPVAWVTADPYLEGDRCPFQDENDLIPLFLGKPPAVYVPLPLSGGQEPEFTKWFLSLRSVGPAKPIIDFRKPLSDFMDNISHSETAFRLDLSGCLDETSLGTFHLSLFDPQGLEFPFDFYLWPKLNPRCLPRVFPLDPELGSSFYLSLPPDTTCTVTSPQGEVELVPSGIASKITVSTDVREVEISLSIGREEDNRVLIPFRMPLPRLQWRFVLPELPEGDVSWRVRSLEIPADALLHAPSAYCQLGMHGIAELYSRFSLCLATGDSILQEEAFQTERREHNLLRLPLAAFLDTIRHCDPSIQSEFRLRVQEKDIEDYPIAYISREYSVSSIQLIKINELAWRLQWLEPFPINNRRFQLKSLWRPWQIPLEDQIPDTSRESFILEGTSLPAGRYEIRMAAAPCRFAFPVNASSTVLDIGDSSDCLVNEISSTPPEKYFCDTFERLLILSYLNKAIEDQINICIRIIKEGAITKLPLLLSFYTWISGGKSREDSRKSVLHWMFQPQILQSVYANYSRTDPLRMQFLSLLEIHPLLSRESLVLILQHEADNPKIVAACWNQLLSRYNSPGGFSLSETMDLIFEAIQQNHLFPRDAAALLSVRFSDVVPYLLHTNSSLKVALLAFLLPYAASPEEEIAKMDSTLIASISDFNVGSNMHSLILSTLVQRNDCVGVQLALRDYLEQAVDLCTTINILNVNKTFSSKILHSLKPEPSLAVLLSTLEELVTSEVLKE